MVGFLELILFILGSITGFLAGLLGIGGAIILIPMLMYIPPYFGFIITFHNITGLTMTMAFFSSLTGTITHYKGDKLCNDLIIFLGGTMLVGSFVGSVVSKYVVDKYLVGVYAFVTVVSIYMLLSQKKEKPKDVETELEGHNSLLCEINITQRVINYSTKSIIIIIGYFNRSDFWNKWHRWSSYYYSSINLFIKYSH